MRMRLSALLWCSLITLNLSAQSIDKAIVDSVEVYFDFGMSQLRFDAQQSLAEFQERVAIDTNMRFTIVAHTDSIGNADANLRLSEKRAKSIVNYLHESGIDKTIIDWTFKGESIPQSSNATEVGRQRNRRATVLLWQPRPPREPLGYLKGKVLDEGGDPLEAEVSLKISGQKPRTTTSDSLTGAFAIPFFREELGLGILEVYAKGHFFHSQVADLYKAPSLDIKIKLKETVAGEKMALNKLYFVGNQAVLLPKSVPELKRLLRFMEINSDTKVEIGGHVNHPFTPPEDLPPWSMELSVSRARVVYEYLTENGINEDRMAYKGYGNSQMVYPRTRIEAEMKKNRRVEIKIISIEEE